MNLMGKPPLGLKEAKPEKDPAYLAAIHELPCCICEAYGEPQLSPTQAHHPIHGRHSQIKTGDRMAIPLCFDHHQGHKGVHTHPDWWRAAYGLDTDYIAVTQDRMGV